MAWRRAFEAFVVSLASAQMPAGRPDGGTPMTLEEAVNIATSQAFEVRIARAEANRAKAVIAEARASVLPRLTFDASYTRFTKENKATFDPMEPPIVFRPIDRASLQINLSQPVDVSGAAGLGLSGAWALKRESDALVAAAVNDAAVRAKAAFLGVLNAQELVGVAEEQVKNSMGWLDLANKRLAAGTAPKFDVIRFESELSAAERELLRAKNGLDLAKSAFNHALARDVASPVDLAKPGGLPRVSKDLATLTQHAKAARPEVQAAARRSEYQTRFRQATQRGNWPSLSLSARASRDPKATGFGSERDTVSATAMLSFPLFEGALTRSRVSQAREEEQKARIALDQTLLNVDLEVRQAYLDVESAAKVIEAAGKNVSLASEALRLANVRYEAGVGTPIEVSDASVQFVRARVGLVTATYDYWEAIARLQRAVGSEEI